MRNLALLVAILFAAGMLALAAEIPADKAVIKFEAKVGTVTFPHKAHVDSGAKCVDCHHTVKEGQTPQKCGACHDPKEAKGAAPRLVDAMHKNCKGCHEKATAAGKKAPGKDCKACHVKAA